ncbi:hypothetical protein DKX38_009937 [Salix brachista]|uniref:Uncharacterized protein n=1 Tax=Salix brachista TaxID=2182728 RepID=A0A5N5MET2_9ROSI|nr:hypothetical protein DKX38_009937 [Salix brachista]
MNAETMQRNRQGRDLPSLPPFIAVLNQEIFLGSKDYSEETLIFSMKETLLWRRLHFMFLLYGETPLHMAAKNGCSEAARLLLAHGAFIEAKANFGTQSVEDRSTVKTLLEYNADCSTEDNVL